MGSPRPSIPVVIAAPPMRTGGTEQHLLYILPELAKRGFDVTAVLLEGGGALESALRKTAIRVIVPKKAIERPGRTLVQAWNIWRAVRASDARIIHAFLSEPYLAAAFAKMIPGTRRASLIHARRSLAFYSSRHPLAQRFERLAHRLSVRLVGNSTAVAQELIRESGTPSKVRVIHNGIPLSGIVTQTQRMEARRMFGLDMQDLVLAMVANFYPYKGHADLIEALGLAAPDMPQPWRLLLAGRDAGERDGLQDRINELGLTANIVFIGEWPGSHEPYAAADIGLLVSHTEGFSNSLIEGMAMGLPMIATAVGGNVDAITSDTNGLLVPSRSPRDLANAILRLARDSETRKRLGDAGHHHAVACFSLETCVDEYEKLWRGLA